MELEQIISVCCLENEHFCIVLMFVSTDTLIAWRLTGVLKFILKVVAARIS